MEDHIIIFNSFESLEMFSERCFSENLVDFLFPEWDSGIAKSPVSVGKSEIIRNTNSHKGNKVASLKWLKLVTVSRMFSFFGSVCLLQSNNTQNNNMQRISKNF